MVNSKSYEVSIVGGGIAGLSVALRLPENLNVALFTKGQLGESNTRYAQGGLTVALGADSTLWTRSQLARMPDGLRDNGNRQTVCFFNPEVIR